MGRFAEFMGFEGACEQMPYKPGDRVITERGHATVSAVDAGERKVHLVYDGPDDWSGWRTVRTVLVLSEG